MSKEDKIKSLGRNIAKFRKEKHLSQNKLAELADISREHIAKVETGKSVTQKIHNMSKV